MKKQASSKELKFCIKCDKSIARKEMRNVDGCLHYHLNCGDKQKPRRTFIQWLCELIK